MKLWTLEARNSMAFFIFAYWNRKSKNLRNTDSSKLRNYVLAKSSTNKIFNLYKTGGVAENYVVVQCKGALYDKVSNFFLIQGVRTQSSYFQNVNTWPFLVINVLWKTFWKCKHSSPQFTLLYRFTFQSHFDIFFSGGWTSRWLSKLWLPRSNFFLWSVHTWLFSMLN